jgi:AraC-like DNA-binding protein
MSRPRGAEFVCQLSNDCEQLVLRIDRAAMQAHTGLRHVVLTPSVDLTGPSIPPWLVHRKTLMDSPDLPAIALECGFGDLGRFTQDDAARFGERPSETRAKAKQRA